MNTESPARVGLVHFRAEALPKVIAKAYELSQPQGMGYLHYQEGPIPAAELAKHIERAAENLDNTELPYLQGLSFDYVLGRAVKLYIGYNPESGNYFLDMDRWYDHSDEALAALLECAAET